MFESLVGPNLEVKREQGAFRTLWGEVLRHDIGDEEHLYLLRLVSGRARALATNPVLEEMLDDDFEHALCEWTKAQRGYAAWEHLLNIEADNESSVVASSKSGLARSRSR